MKTNFTDRDVVWEDIEEFELPATFLENGVKESVKVLSQRLFEMVSYSTQVVQFRPEAQEKLNNLVERINFYEKERKKIIDRHMAKSKEYPVEHRKNKDALIAYIESDVALSSLQKIDAKVIESKQEKIKQLRLLSDIDERYKSLEVGIRVGLGVLSVIKNLSSVAV